MKKFEMDTLNGERIEFRPADVCHRVEMTGTGMRYVTGFVDGHILFAVSEAEMIAFLHIVVMRASQKTDADYNVNAAWMYSLRDLISQVLHRTRPDARNHAEWSKVPEDDRETHAIYLTLLSAERYMECLTAGHFAVCGNPRLGSYDVDTHAALLAPNFAYATGDDRIEWRNIY